MYLVTLLERVGLVKLAREVMEQGKTSKLLFTLKRFSSLEVMWSWNDLNVEFLYLILCCNARSIVTLACFFQLEYLITACSIQKLIPQSPTLWAPWPINAPKRKWKRNCVRSSMHNQPSSRCRGHSGVLFSSKELTVEDYKRAFGTAEVVVFQTLS